MQTVNSSKELFDLREYYKKLLNAENKKVSICADTGCVAVGSLDVYAKLIEIGKEKGINIHIDLKEEKDDTDTVSVIKSGCHGYCDLGPLVRIEPNNVSYTKVTVDDCEEIVNRTLMNDEIIDRLLYKKDGKTYHREGQIPFYANQHKVVLENCGFVNVDSIKEYIALDGYLALQKSLAVMTKESVIDEIIKSKLRGRGGGGFPTGIKWQQVSEQEETTRYIVCNGDEGDPGAFMDRSIMEGNPHQLIEGMIIAAYATGCNEGYIYVRAEYPLAVKRLKNAIADAEKMGIIGADVLGSGFDFNLQISMGAGAFVCGEGSALTASIEGKRGMPRVKPPRTVDQGLFGKPTVLNNVETFANVAMIINNGANWYKSLGTEASPGTKAFAITGNIANTGLIEVPMGTPLRDVIYKIGGGIQGGKKFKAIQIGGPSGGCLVEEHLDVPLDFDSLKKIGAMVGSGGLVVMDEDTCMVEVARFFMNFTQNESCGKCVPCREGTKRMLEILNRIVEGRGELSDIDTLEELASTIKEVSLCGLGKTAPSPVLSTLKYFKDEYIEHIVHKNCPTKTCTMLSKFVVIEDKCIGCTKCARNCPTDAIIGKLKEVHYIDNDKCIKCGVCIDNCAVNAIEEV